MVMVVKEVMASLELQAVREACLWMKKECPGTERSWAFAG
jgi:hypothetical protein